VFGPLALLANTEVVSQVTMRSFGPMFFSSGQFSVKSVKSYNKGLYEVLT